jgi:hypothetical protein
MDTSRSIPPDTPDLALARTPVPPRPRGSLLRFSLRSLLVAVTLLAVGLGAFAYWREGKRREAAAADWLSDHGAGVGQRGGREMSQRPWWVQRLALVLPEECFRTVNFADFPEDTSDAELKMLCDLPNLTQLNLNKAASVTPAGLAPLARLARLEVLYLQETPAGDAGLAHARNLHGLKEIWIQNTGITDASISWIASNPKLTHLDLDWAHITDKSAPLLAKLENLEVLALRDTQITSRGLADIARLPRLTHLYLMRTAVDDEGLMHLAKIESLSNLDVRLTRVTAEGVEQFRRARPGCRLEGY